MSCPVSCQADIGQYAFVYVNESTTFQNAINGCEQLNLVLASNLTRNDYLVMNLCCSNATTYRIGLVAGGGCSSGNASTPYSWNSNFAECVSEGALVLPNPPTGCHTATVTVGTNTHNIPDADWNQCHDELPYICQKRRVPPSFNSDSPTFQSNHSNCSPTHTWALIGGAAGFALAVLLVAVLYCFSKKQNLPTLREKGMNGCNGSREHSNNNPIKNQQDSSSC